MEFEENVELTEHVHGTQIRFVLERKIELIIGVEKKSFSKKDRYYIPVGVSHPAGYMLVMRILLFSTKKIVTLEKVAGDFYRKRTELSF